MTAKLIRPLLLTAAALFVSAVAFATMPTVTVTSPANNSQTTSPVNYVATASSPDCAQGISSIEIYSSPKNVAYTVAGGQLDAYINLPAGTYNTVVQAFDNCGGVGNAEVTITTTGETTPGGFVYTVNTNPYTYTTNFVYGFTIVAANGALAPTGQGPVNANVDPMSITSDQGGYRLYVGDYVSGDVFAYFIDRANGYIFPIPGSPYPVNHSVTAVAVHPSGNWVFATRNENMAGDGVAVFAVQSDGTLVQAVGSPYPTQPGPWTMAMDPSGKYLYVGTTAYYGDNKYFYVDGFSFDATLGVLTPLPGSPFAFQIPSDCGYTQISADGMIDLSSQYLYTIASGIDEISGAAIGGSGNLTELSGSPWLDEEGCTLPLNSQPFNYWFNAVSLAVDGTGKWMYVLNLTAQNIGIYSIAANGALTFVKYAAAGDVCEANLGTDVTGNYLYVGNCFTSTVYLGWSAVSGFVINHTTGDLTPTPGSPYTYPTGGTYNNYVIPMALTVTP
jgi:6-phosphogluconolactonase